METMLTSAINSDNLLNTQNYQKSVQPTRRSNELQKIWNLEERSY